MTDFRIAFEAWSNRPPELGDLAAQEKLCLQALRTACEAAGHVEWWNDYLDVGKSERGLHYGVNFGYEVTNGDVEMFSERIRVVVAAKGFEFELGPVTVW